ncbi:MAG: endonuclease I, partial [Flavobacterium sp.]
MKKIFTLALLFAAAIASAQIPSGYYNTATGTGYTLKTQLYNIIKGHTDNGYDGLYTTYQTSDRDYYY